MGKKEPKEGVWKIFRLEISKRNLDPEESERPVQHVVTQLQDTADS